MLARLVEDPDRTKFHTPQGPGTMHLNTVGLIRTETRDTFSRVFRMRWILSISYNLNKVSIFTKSNS
jgi:hypothetical protein